MRSAWDWLTRGMRRGISPRIYVFGDSHTLAFNRALAFEGRAERYPNIKVLRIRKIKNGSALGDESLDHFCARIARLRPSDHVFSAIGGNQYSVVSTIRDEKGFVVLNERTELGAVEPTEVVPRRAFHSFIDSGVWHSDGPILRRIRGATAARVYHLTPPPPKFDNEFIRQYHESRFAAAGLGVLEPTEPSFRLECWKMQQQSLSALCLDADITLVPPPAAALTPEGFLDRPYYSKDVTHANRRYGEHVLRQIMEIAGLPHVDGANAK